jgi:predicted PurR-regulated permease PerM
MGDETPAQVVPLSRKERNSIALNGLFVIAVLFTLYFAASLLLPIVVAVLLSILLAPAVRAARRVGVPEPLSAAILVVALAIGLAATALLLTTPAQQWFERIPANFHRIEAKMRLLKKPLSEIQSTTETLETATEVGPRRPLEVKVKRPGIVAQLLSGTPQVLTSVGMVVLLLFMLLASGDAFLRKLVAITPAFEDKKRAVEITRSIQTDISLYLGTLTLLNGAVGTIVAAVCWALGIDNPLLWGVVATTLSFAPYVGSAVVFGLLAFTGLLQFDSWWWALLPAISYILTMFICGNVIIPFLVGRRLTLSPLAIFVAIVFWGWMWGVVGALVAVPLLASFKIVCDRIDPLQPVAEFLAP